MTMRALLGEGYHGRMKDTDFEAKLMFSKYCTGSLLHSFCGHVAHTFSISNRTQEKGASLDPELSHELTARSRKRRP